MAQNGNAALQLVTSEPQPAQPTASEIEIGVATADACMSFAGAMLEFYETSLMPRSIREAGADKLARLAHMSLDTYGEIDFDAIARREGLRCLRRLLDVDPDFRRRVTGAPWRHGGGEAALTVVVDGVLEIVGRVVRLERALRAN